MLVMLLHQDPLARLHRGQGSETGVDVDESLAQVLHPHSLEYRSLSFYSTNDKVYWLVPNEPLA